MKPCYLMGKPGMRVALDGPALSVSAPGRAATLLPLQRISRVIASGPVDWSTAALMTCAERGVTVTFLQGDGSVRAYLFGASVRRDDLLCRLRDLLDRPDWPERYEDWRKAMRSRARRSLCRRLGLAPDALSESQLNDALHRSCSHYVTPGQRRYLERRLQGLTAALAAELLGRVGLTAESIRCLNGRLHLLDDITEYILTQFVRCRRLIYLGKFFSDCLADEIGYGDLIARSLRPDRLFKVFIQPYRDSYGGFRE